MKVLAANGSRQAHGYLETRNGKADRLSRRLGWASLGLGVAQVAAPRVISRISGVDDSIAARTVVPLVGVRELTHAVGLLRGRRPTGWVWTRVVGDAVDLTLLTRALRERDGARRRRAAVATAAVAGITVVDVVAAVRARRARSGSLHLRASVTIKRPAEELYRMWRDFENLPQFMTHLESVQVLEEGRSRWKAQAPVGKAVEWDAEIIEDEPDEVIAWRSLKGADVRNSGSVRFRPAPGDQGTEVRVDVVYDLPGGKLGAAFAKLFGEHPEQQVRDDLRRFKQVMETGEVLRSAGSPEGTSALRQLKQRPAQPLAPSTR